MPNKNEYDYTEEEDREFKWTVGWAIGVYSLVVIIAGIVVYVVNR